MNNFQIALEILKYVESPPIIVKNNLIILKFFNYPITFKLLIYELTPRPNHSRSEHINVPATSHLFSTF